MNRLRDDNGDDPVEAKGIKLVRATPPAPAVTELKRRVWVSLQHSAARMPMPLTRRMSWLSAARIRAFALAATIVCVAGSAGAVIVGRWIAPDRADSASSDPLVEVKASNKATTKRRIVESKSAVPAAAEPKILESVTLEAQSRPTVKAVTSRPVGASVVRAPRPAPAMADPTSTSTTSTSAPLEGMPSMGSVGARERTEVLDAMVALRRDHDPVRAGALLDRYLASHPQGALREEALVLAIEAADGRGDQLAARGFARAYESKYPTGRFRQFAHGHVK